MILDTTTKKLVISLGSAETANHLPITVDYVDMTLTTTIGGSFLSVTNGATQIDILPAPSSNAQRKVNAIQIVNLDTAPAAVSVYFSDNGTLYKIASVMLAVGDMFGFTDMNGWYVQKYIQTDVVELINAQHGTTYTVSSTDVGKLVTFDSASAITVTLPTNAVTPIAIGSRIDFSQLGAGKITISGAGTTINSNGGLVSSGGQYAIIGAIKIDTDTWLLTGNLS